ncbi:hypothetical protein [Shewanella cyperi]|uniref:hypothetical protein n=1 Tax=Shewanella cyperi TaxID=2814292 RepID=UPI001A94A448|nr:hypothetical protein [Shewanella cyperi]QSX41177.1 hypothetical protein JYB84_01735 [Shewanella cyperi]
MNGFVKVLFVAAVAYGGYDQYQKHYAVKPKSEVAWQSFSLDSVDVNVMFPKNPRIERHNVDGLDVEWQGVRFGSADYSLVVTHNLDFNIDDAYPHALTNKGAKLVSKTNVMVDGHYGYEFKMDFGQRQITQRMIDFYDVLVTQTAIYPEADSDDAARFLDSLAL